MKAMKLWSVTWGRMETKTNLLAADTLDEAVKSAVEWMQQEKPDAGMSKDDISELRSTGTVVVVP